MDPRSIVNNREGLKLLQEKKPSEAQQKFLEALIKDPLEAGLHFNLALTYDLLGQVDKAQSSYKTSLDLAQDDEIKFRADFNLGLIEQKQKKVDEALAYYQEALKYHPDSNETKINIELLTQENQGKKGQNGDDKDQKQKDQDQKDQNKEGQDQKDKKDDKKDQEQKKKEYAPQKPQPRKFKSEELTQGDVNKILGEIKQQEQKIRAEFNKKEVKEKPRDKDW
ncbi:MAG: hypothetical protein COT73_12300 [Bdellovibrio sp. CG10_big_fil_rev_8_21_14_0_10_47_8]|nr:MAG: hypothetical protein COT73_12300 [Bdellovibrio sp. CG10_big_fil_rev_8_21_14_0_10_47_8]